MASAGVSFQWIAILQVHVARHLVLLLMFRDDGLAYDKKIITDTKARILGLHIVSGKWLGQFYSRGAWSRKIPVTVLHLSRR